MALQILLVDDSPMIHNLLRKVLVKNGHEICGDAKNGKEGVEMYKSLQPDLIFMDISMPIMSGLEAAAAIKKLNPDSKIIMLSAMGDEAVLTEARVIGINLFLKKPFDEYKIISAISSVA
ncbi:MAG TPA: two-component system response regulator [Firmicutes bacterium]|jgi:two-component system, chemotaxis family, chemotaxis protein CheY|nr:two-component system response regulator [Bacillota bacterium]